MLMLVIGHAKPVMDIFKNELMLVCYIGECMVSLININSGIKEPTHGYQICNTTQILIFGGYVKVRESLYARVIAWVNAILNHIDTRVDIPRYESSCMVYRPKWYRKQKYRQLPISNWYQKV